MSDGAWEFQGYDETDKHEMLMHDRYQREGTSDYEGDHGVLVFVATSPDDGDERGSVQAKRLRELMNLVAPDGVIPPMTEMLLGIAHGMHFLFADPDEDGQS